MISPTRIHAWCLAGLAVCATFALAQEAPRKLTLEQAIELALRQNPDIVLAHLDEQAAALDADLQREPLLPRTVAMSGIAYSTGFPLSMENSAPSVLRLTATRSLFNRTKAYELARARETARGAEITTAAKQEEVALRTAILYLDLELYARSQEVAARQVENQQRVLETIRARVDEGKELPIAAQRASLEVARARQRTAAFARNRRLQQQALAQVIGLNPETELDLAAYRPLSVSVPPSEDESVTRALENSSEIKKLESDLLAHGYQVKAEKAARLPVVSLVADYAMLARYNNYDEYFNAFRRNNYQVGASITFPLFPTSDVTARTARAEIEITRIRAELNAARGRITVDAGKAWQTFEGAKADLDFARQDLDVARQELSLLLESSSTGKATLADLERARFTENEKWLQFYEATSRLEVARLELLGQTGTLLAAVRH